MLSLLQIYIQMYMLMRPVQVTPPPPHAPDWNQPRSGCVYVSQNQPLTAFLFMWKFIFLFFLMIIFGLTERVGFGRSLCNEANLLQGTFFFVLGVILTHAASMVWSR